jgi:hypothetical protein
MAFQQADLFQTICPYLLDGRRQDFPLNITQMYIIMMDHWLRYFEWSSSKVAKNCTSQSKLHIWHFPNLKVSLKGYSAMPVGQLWG